MTTWVDLESYQPVAVKMLQHSITRQRIAHAYLFHGPPGTGKQEASLLFAMRYFCEHIDESTAEPCHQCHSCKRIKSGNHPDLHWIEPDGQSIKKDQIEYLQKEFTYTGLESNQKVYVIMQAEKMTVNAANRLLKFLEEPSRETVAILITDHAGRMLDTIVSRCQRVQFHTLSNLHLYNQLVEKGLTESTASLFAAMKIDVDQAVKWNEDDWFAEARKIVIQLMDRVMNSNEEGYLYLHQVYLKHFKGRDALEFGLELLLIWFQDIVSFHLDKQGSIVLIDQKERLEQYHYVVSLSEAKTLIYEILNTKRKLAQNVHPTLAMEYLILQLQR
ncbi:DNA polymerase III subunit delta' [Tenuibacillus multivorans]|uniref:DNA polymerase-3 subunit delta n=1 Tax=Tenuibacillus multivorans TaxID=237069 RepID=A0A1G9W1E9_9BACI|nr:DNA polymerase III subunit delta' [Tenuibacillus multivorans]GEL78278.1 DNA polymerase III subunit delta' [Tenuibacillus multivorans]SDM78349.1 DNA polymerase-3 subunit delta' [Tenuibacillus multivorans]